MWLITPGQSLRTFDLLHILTPSKILFLALLISIILSEIQFFSDRLLLYTLVEFGLNWQFWFFGPNLPKKDICAVTREKRKSPLNSGYASYSRYQT